jgi:hypothetical protein
MKKSILVCILTIFALSYPASGQDDLRSNYQNKIDHYDHLKSKGRNLAIWGTILTIGGTALLIYGVNKYETPETGNYLYASDYDYESLLIIECGALLDVIGIPMFAGGLVIKSNATRKSNEYRNKINNLSMGVICNPKIQGLSLVYRF